MTERELMSVRVENLTGKAHQVPSPREYVADQLPQEASQRGTKNRLHRPNLRGQVSIEIIEEA